jgi:predicted permease
MLEANPDSYSPAFGATLVPVREQVLGDVRTPILVLLGAVGFVLLIACANVANLLLARSEARGREVAVRTALGAARGRIVRQLLTESVVLALLGGVGGLLLAYWGVSALVAAAPASVPRVAEVGVDGRVLAFTLLVSLGTGLLFGTVPALHATRADLHGMLKDGGRGSTVDAGRQRFRRAMVVTEIALALVLVVGAGLLIQSFARLRGVDAGFDPDGVLTMQLALPPSTYAEKGQVWAFYRQALDRVRALPGVKAAGAVRALPMTGPVGDWGLRVEGRPAPGPHEEGIAGDWQVVTPDYFRTLGIRLVRGRLLTEADDDRAVPAILVNEELAKRAWPDGEAVGRRLMLGGTVDSVWRTVVGVVADVRQQGLDAAIRPELYLPHAQWPAGDGTPQRNMALVVRGNGDVTALAGAIRREIRRIDSNLPVSDVRTMNAVVGSWAAERRLTTLVLGAFALVALALAAVGIYAVMAYAVVRRTHEIGIRMALGAAERDVLGMVVGQGVALALIGVAVGLAAALALTRLMSSMLYEVSATDPATFAGLALLLAAVAVAATYVPARRATRVDPMVALRSE